MPALYFLQKQDIGGHGRDGLLDTMNARSRAYGTNAFVNIPGRNAKFHSEQNQETGLQMLRQLQNCFSIGGGKTLIRRFAP